MKQVQIGPCNSTINELSGVDSRPKYFRRLKKSLKRSLRSVVVNVLDSNIVEGEFELQLCYYIHLRTHIFGKGMNPLISPTPSMG